VLGADGSLLASVERKALDDLAGSLSNGSLVFELSKLAELPRAALVVEDRYSRVLAHRFTPGGSLPDLLARVQVRYPEVLLRDPTAGGRVDVPVPGCCARRAGLIGGPAPRSAARRRYLSPHGAYNGRGGADEPRRRPTLTC
jgi:hypothetical protein